MWRSVQTLWRYLLGPRNTRKHLDLKGVTESELIAPADADLWMVSEAGFTNKAEKLRTLCLLLITICPDEVLSEHLQTKQEASCCSRSLIVEQKEKEQRPESMLFRWPRRSEQWWPSRGSPAHHGSMNLMNERVFHVENCSCNHKHKCYGKVIGVITGMGSDSGAFPEHKVSSANISMETPRTLTCSDTHHTRNTFTPSHSAYSRTC